MCGFIKVTQIMTLFQNFNFMASINNVSIYAIVVVFFTYFYDYSPLFSKLFESSLPEVLRSGRDPDLQCELHILAVIVVPSASEVFQAPKCMEIVWRDVRRRGWISSQSPSAFAG